MEHQRASGFGKAKEIPAKLIVQSSQLANGLGRQALQKTAQGRFVRELFEAEQCQKEPVVLKLVGFVYSLNSDDQKEKQHLNQVDRIELGPFGSGAQDTLKPTAKIQFVTKSLNQEESAVVCEAIRFE